MLLSKEVCRTWEGNDAMNDITAVILTKNEELNIRRCIESIIGLADHIVVVDSGSTDQTLETARELGAEIYQHVPFEHYARQFNWALDNVDIRTKWIFRIDADEAVTPELREEIIQACRNHQDDDVNGFVMRFRLFFMGRFLRHGGAYPIYKLTIFKHGYGRFEDRPMGEHVILSEGRTLDLKNDCLHLDYKNLTAWIDKHNWYATREVNDYFTGRDQCPAENTLYHHAHRTGRLRDNLYYKLPMFWRVRLYFWYRYYFKLGFLDGKEGKVYCFLQAYWYRFLIDAKIMEQNNEGQSRLFCQ